MYVHVCVCVCAAFPRNAIEIRDKIMQRGGQRRPADTTYPNIAKTKKQKKQAENKVSQHCFCAGPRLEMNYKCCEVGPHDSLQQQEKQSTVQ